jgi:hypothetical protein
MSKQETQFNFSEILAHALETETVFSSEFYPNQNIEWSSNIDPMHLSYLLGNLEIDSISPAIGLKNPYLKYKKTIVSPDHVLAQPEQSAFELINLYLPMPSQLTKNFNMTQLKRAYKKAALRAHPDCGGTHERFLQLKSDCELLVAFLNSIK